MVSYDAQYAIGLHRGTSVFRIKAFVTSNIYKKKLRTTKFFRILMELKIERLAPIVYKYINKLKAHEIRFRLL